MSKKVIKIPRSLGLFTLAMINVAAVGNVRNFPFMAEYGFASIFWLLLSALIFIIPVSLISAELATGWPERGGVYAWVKAAFGKRIGFMAAWLQWLENVVWYPTILTFITATLAYVFAPSMAHSTTYALVTLVILFWAATLANFFGMYTSGWISKLGAFCTLIIPGSIIIGLGAMWLIEGNPSQISFGFKDFIPDFSLEQMVFFTGVFLAFGGLEMSAAHAKEVENPQKQYPKAIFLSALLILSFTIFGVLAVAVVVPQKDISLVAGAMQAMEIFFQKYRLTTFLPFIAVIMALGSLGSVSTWIIGPSKALLAAAEDGDLPKVFKKMNRKGVPTSILLTQACIVTVLSFIFLLMPTVSSAYWIINVLAAQFYLVMYILLFLAGIALRYKYPKQKRLYKIPGKNWGMWTVGLIGIVGALFGLLIGYFPPAQITTGNEAFYTGFLVICTLAGCTAPFLIYRSHKVDRPR